MDAMDESYIWRRRIIHGIRFQKGAIPFPDSVEIGLEFNAVLERKEKLDPSLLTNGVLLELADFAKTVTRSEKYFLFEMLEFNFDLGMDADSDGLLYTYAIRVHGKAKQLKEQIKMKPGRWKEVFALPDPSLIRASAGSELSACYCPKWNKVADSSVLTFGSKNGKSSENQRSNGFYMIKKQGRIQLKRPEDLYPFCTQAGVSLVVQPERTPIQKLDSSLLTNGVMIEMLDFSRVLCGTYTLIVHDLVKQNFGVELNKMHIRMQLNRLVERKYGCLTAEDKDALRKATFIVEAEKKHVRKYTKRKKHDIPDQELEVVSKRRETLRQRSSETKGVWHDDDLSYMCPVDFEAEMQSDNEAEPENIKLESCPSEVRDMRAEEEEAFTNQPQTNGHNPEGVKVETHKQKLWRRRGARSEQILMTDRVNDLFAHCREIGLDFSVCSDTRQKLDLQLFTNWVIWEVYRFASAMSKSLRTFLCEILHYNFNIALQDEVRQRNFISYLFSKEKSLLNHPYRHSEEFLRSSLKFPEVYNMVDVSGSINLKREVKTDPQENSISSYLGVSRQADMDRYPFCTELGLDLWSTNERPSSQKLGLTTLTPGALLEIFSFIRELSGNIHDSVNDILEHNFDLDLQNGNAKAAQAIQRWFVLQKSMMKNQTLTPKVTQWLNKLVPLTGNLWVDHQPPMCDDPQSPETDDVKPDKETLDFNEGIQQVKTRLNNYHICKEIGLDLDVGAKSEAKAKLNLRVLTRGVLFEMHQYVTENCRRYVPALYEILEYNFDLSSQSHRRVEFAWSIASQVLAIAAKHGRKGEYLNKVFELPFEISESSLVVCKKETEDSLDNTGRNDDDVTFVRKLEPVDIEVEID